MKKRIPIVLKENGDRAYAEALAVHLKTQLSEEADVLSPSAEGEMQIEADECVSSSAEGVRSVTNTQVTGISKSPVWLSVDADGLSLTDGDQTMRGDFTKLQKRLQYHNLTHELLVKATKVKGRENLRVIDATAGMGEDSLLLAAAGCEVTLYEQDPVIAALLKDTMRRALEEAALHEIVMRMQLVEGDSIDHLRKLGEAGTGSDAPEDDAGHDCSTLTASTGTGNDAAAATNGADTALKRPDVIYLDPMFPERQKSGLVKKKFQLIHYLEAPAENEEALMQAAIAAHPFKIVVKRPAKGPQLAGLKPSYSLDGKAIRYDCYVFPENA